jgi:hypothetical protein
MKKYIFGWCLIGAMMSSAAMAQIPGSVNEESPEPDTLPEVVFDGSDPCPEPRAALGNTPNELKAIQEDITRFTLCLQRAQLLNRLNDLASDNIDTINSTLDDKIMSFMNEMELPEMPAIPVAASAPAPVPEMPDMPMSSSSQNNVDYMEPMPVEPLPPIWSVREVKGRGGDLIAVLVDDESNVVHVKSGEKIPEDEATVRVVNPTTVILKTKESESTLSWVN